MSSREVQIFIHEEYGTIHTVVDGDKVRFCGTDVARAVGYKDSSIVSIRCRDEPKGSRKYFGTNNSGRTNQKLRFITETDLRLLVSHRMPMAQPLLNWLLTDVKPATLRNHVDPTTVENVRQPNLFDDDAQPLPVFEQQPDLEKEDPRMESGMFTHELFGTIRTVEDGDHVLFCGRDVATALGYSNSSDALRRHCRGVVKRYPTVDALKRRQETAFITEPDLYRLVASSQLPTAQQFEAWIFEEVLPSVRRHGGYLTPQTVDQVLSDPDTIIRLATDLKEARAEQSRLEAQAALDAPKVEFADAVHCSSSSISMGELAKLLRQNGYEVGRTRLFELLRNDGFLCRIGDQWNLPSQRAMESELFEVHESVVSMNGRQVVRHSTKVTGKGQRYFVSRFLDGRLPKNTVLNRPRTKQYFQTHET